MADEAIVGPDFRDDIGKGIQRAARNHIRGGQRDADQVSHHGDDLHEKAERKKVDASDALREDDDIAQYCPIAHLEYLLVCLVGHRKGQLGGTSRHRRILGC